MIRRRTVIITLISLPIAALLVFGGTRTGRALFASTDGFIPFSADQRILYEPGAEAYAEEVQAILNDAVERVQRRQGVFPEPVAVFICASQESFNAYVPRGFQARGAVFLGKLFLSPRAFTTNTHAGILVHELSHLQWIQRLGTFSYQINFPVWFQEGFAVFLSNGGGAEPVDPAAARQAILAGETFTPEESGALLIPRTAQSYGLQGQMFYRQSALFVTYLHRRDEAAFRRFLTALQNGTSFADAFTSFGGTVREMWDQFLTELKRES